MNYQLLSINEANNALKSFPCDSEVNWVEDMATCEGQQVGTGKNCRSSWTLHLAWARVVDQQVKTPAAKPEDLCKVLVTNIVGDCPFSSTHVPWHV